MLHCVAKFPITLKMVEAAVKGSLTVPAATIPASPWSTTKRSRLVNCASASPSGSSLNRAVREPFMLSSSWVIA